MAQSMYDAYIAHTPCGTSAEKNQAWRDWESRSERQTELPPLLLQLLHLASALVDLLLPLMLTLFLLPVGSCCCQLVVACLTLWLFVDFSDLAHNALSLSLSLSLACALLRQRIRLNTPGKYMLGLRNERTWAATSSRQSSRQRDRETDRGGDPADRQQVNVMSQQYS